MLLLQLGAVSPTDARVLRDAREAQQRFEVTRRWNLPRSTSGKPDRCDAVIGRFCYWHDSTGTTPPPDVPRIAKAREELHAALEVAARALPADGWVAGQRVRYLIEGEQFDAAVAAARVCAADPWWCAALEGLALHTAQRYVASDSAFSLALTRMPPERRCEWLDLRDITSGAISKEFARADCGQRAELARRLWLLGRPLWSTPGNDAATEHFARHTMSIILASAATPGGMSFGDDNRALLLRYGWAEWFTKEESSPYQVSSPQVIGHDREPSYHFHPDAPTLRSMPRLTRDSWWLRKPMATSRYAPRHVTWQGELRHQLARFPRGDSLLLVASYRLSDPALARDSVVVGSIATFDGSAAGIVASTQARQIFAMVPSDTTIASIEAVGQGSKRSERARYTVDPLPCSRWCLSDLLLFVARDSSRDVPLETAAREAIVEAPVRAATPLGVYWEVAGVGVTPLDLALTIEPIHVSRLRRAAARIKLASEPSTVRLRWVEVPDSTRTAHSLSLRLPASARGRLRVTLTIEPRGFAPQTTSREIEVVR